MLERLLNTHQTLHATRYLLSVVGVISVAYALIWITFHYLGEQHMFVPLSYFLAIVYSGLALCCLLMLTIQRLNTLNKVSLWSLLLLVPIVNIGLFIVLLYCRSPRG